jgi:transcriptional regulator with XRE-family HTH domain
MVQAQTDASRDPGCSFCARTLTLGRPVPRKKSPPPKEEGSFGNRLASLRQAAGLSQRQLEKLSGVSNRMIAYYEKRSALPPGHVLAALADALGSSVDELVGKKQPARAPRKTTSRPLLRRLEHLEQLPLKDKRELLGIIDTYLERHRLAQRASG